MPQNSLLYAVGRLRMLRRRALSEGQLQRLISADNLREAEKALREFGYLAQQESDIDQATADKLKDAALMLRQLSPAPETTDAFLLRHDVLNLKILVKARILGIAPEGLSQAGTLDVEMLKRAVNEHKYQALPSPLQETMDELEKQIVLSPDPMLIDVRLDQAMYRLLAQGLRRAVSPAAKAWLKARADFVNLRSLLRLQGIPASLTLEQVLVEGGSLSPAAFLKAAEKPQKLTRLYTERYGAQIGRLIHRAFEDAAAISPLEQAMEAHLQGLFQINRMEPDNLDVLIDYLLSMEREASKLRLIFAGKRNGLKPDIIEERLRAVYGQ